MNFDPENKIVQLCAKGMEREGEGNMKEAAALFTEAWKAAVTPAEKYIAAHYVARHQPTVAGKLSWDETALNSALAASDPALNPVFPSLYLNVAKCHEDLGHAEQARKNYKLALSFTKFLPEDGYGKLITSGIKKGIERLADN